MEIVIATPYKIANFGAMLQAWALRVVLERMGHRVRYLNCRYMWPGVFGWRRLLCSRSFAAFKNKLRMNRLMRNAMRELGPLPETRPYDSVAALVAHPPKADCFLAGSDQIFSPSNFLSRKRYLPVLLGFGDRSTKRIAYAASFGTHTSEKLVRSQEIDQMIRDFAAIGIRERSGVRILKEWVGVEGEWTPDPTLLLSAEDYRKAFSVVATVRGGGGVYCDLYARVAESGAVRAGLRGCKQGVRQHEGEEHLRRALAGRMADEPLERFVPDHEFVSRALLLSDLRCPLPVA